MSVGAVGAAGVVRGEPRRCPACGATLVEVERSDMLINVCPACRGVRLDRGGLDKVWRRNARPA